MSLQQRAIAAAGQWIEQRADWTYWVTLTFRRHVTFSQAQFAERAWASGVAVMAGRRHLNVAVALEQMADGQWHAHALVEIPADARPTPLVPQVEEAWKRADALAGNAKVERYQKGGGAAAYLAKEGDWNVYKACPREPRCRHRDGCVEAIVPWHVTRN